MFLFFFSFFSKKKRERRNLFYIATLSNKYIVILYITNSYQYLLIFILKIVYLIFSRYAIHNGNKHTYDMRDLARETTKYIKST